VIIAKTTGAGAGGHRHEHRHVVNRLAAMLEYKGRVDKGCAEAIAQEAGDPPDIHPDTPKGRSGRIDLGLPPRIGPDSQGEGEWTQCTRSWAAHAR
jgi:hypothetical protein